MKAKEKVKIQVKKGDIVHIIGGKEAGARSNKMKRGKILNVHLESGRVIVERMNLIKRHSRPNKTNRQGGIIEREGMIHHSNVMIVCPSCDLPTRVKMVTLDDGKKVRACHKCNEILDK
jgi:large subunit ribosomal protein L24